MFKPCKVTHQRFLDLGVLGKYAVINASIIYDDQMHDAVQRNLVTLGRRIAQRQVIEFFEGRLRLKPNTPYFKNTVGWDSNLTPAGKKIEFKDVPRPEGERGRPNVYSCGACFLCPKCRYPRAAT